MDQLGDVDAFRVFSRVFRVRSCDLTTRFLQSQSAGLNIGEDLGTGLEIQKTAISIGTLMMSNAIRENKYIMEVTWRFFQI